MPLDALLRRFRRRTSIADSSAYLDVCRRAARDDAAFATFKRDPAYTRILEHTTPEQGAAYLAILERSAPDLVARLDDFRANDRLGGAAPHDYGDHGAIAPSTLRYVKVYADLRHRFGDLSGLDVIEIGGGYGGQALVAHLAGGVRSWTLVDLPPCLELAARYLAAAGMESARTVPMERLDGAGPWDLLVSNYAFTECTRAVQTVYLDRALRRARRGYLIGNEIAPASFRSMTRDELVAALDGARVLPEDPPTHARNWLLVWGDDGAGAGR